MMAKSKVSDYEIIYKGEQPTYIRDEGGMLFEFPHINRWPGQDQRYQEEKDEQIALAEYLLDCLGKRMITVKVRNGLPHIDGKLCSYETEEIRSKIQEFAEVSEEFILPKKYTYVITELHGFAKIIKAPK